MATETIETTDTTTQTGSEPKTVTPPAAAADETPATFDAWLAKNDPDGKVKPLATAWHDAETQGLQKALKAERENNKKQAAELRDAAKGADDATAAKLNELAAERETAERRAQFYEQAVTEGCQNLRLAWIAAKDGDFFDKRGEPDLASLQAKYPELFAKPTAPPPRVSAGSGTTTPAGTTEVDPIRAAIAGRRANL